MFEIFRDCKISLKKDFSVEKNSKSVSILNPDSKSPVTTDLFKENINRKSSRKNENNIFSIFNCKL